MLFPHSRGSRLRSTTTFVVWWRENPQIISYSTKASFSFILRALARYLVRGETPSWSTVQASWVSFLLFVWMLHTDSKLHVWAWLNGGIWVWFLWHCCTLLCVCSIILMLGTFPPGNRWMLVNRLLHVHFWPGSGSCYGNVSLLPCLALSHVYICKTRLLLSSAHGGF